MFMQNVGVCNRRLVCSFIYFTVFHKHALRMNLLVPITKLSDEASCSSPPSSLDATRIIQHSRDKNSTE
jgi:hypothetical protein